MEEKTNEQLLSEIEQPEMLSMPHNEYYEDLIEHYPSNLGFIVLADFEYEDDQDEPYDGDQYSVMKLCSSTNRYHHYITYSHGQSVLLNLDDKGSDDLWKYNIENYKKEMAEEEE